MKRKILYLMHVDWNWIKQRPHFIAENLSKSFDVTVCSAKTYRKKQMVKNGTEAQLKLKQLFIFPFGRFRLVSQINSMLIKFQLIKAIAKVDIVWITHPLMFEPVRNLLPQDTKLVYDCMDDALEFPLSCVDDVHRFQLLELEKSLVNRCDIVFASSDYLSVKLTHRYGNHINSCVVNNAISLPENYQSENSDDMLRFETLMNSITGKKLLYIGTISDWMDFDLILSSVERIPGITYVFVGPCEIPIPCHDRLIFFGPIEHRYIFRAMKSADVMIMPFKVNELIKSVNPVKIYDYIYSCKIAIVTGYGETAKFDDFIHIYFTPEEYMLKLEMLVVDNLEIKKSSDECLSFIKKNTWPNRVAQMLTLLH